MTTMKRTNSHIMPLGLLSEGEKAEVLEIGGLHLAGSCGDNDAGPKPRCGQARVEDMGLRAGKVVEMLNNGGRGAMLIKIDESRIAIGRGMAMRIMVKKK